MVFGASGMLGRELMLALGRAGHVARGPVHQSCDISDAQQVARVLRESDADIVINAAGVFDAAGKWPVQRASEYIRVNSLGPQVLAEIAHVHSARLLHISTDCVFSGKAAATRSYHAHDTPSPTDLYGRSKLAGEPEGDHVTVVRTSFIGPMHGLMRWFMNQPKREVVPGYRRTRWSGSTAEAVAEAIVERLANGTRPAGVLHRPFSGLVHLATERAISKYELLLMLRRVLKREDISVTATETPNINRALAPSPGWVLPPVEEALARYVQPSR